MADALMVTLTSPAEPYVRADLAFHGVDHSKASFEGRLFINNATAGPDTVTDDANGYAGSFWIFGHGGCAGAEGHCEPPQERRAFDFRPPHQLIPVSKRVIVTGRLQALVAPGADFTVRIIAVVRPAHAASLPGNLVTDLLHLERVDLVTYQ
jgi:hypothetical protein